MNSPIVGHRLRRFEFPRNRPIGDSQIRVPDVNWVGTVELIDSKGLTGLGFFASLLEPLPLATELRAYYARTVWPDISGTAPEALLNRISHPRGGQVRSVPHGLGDATEEALWDLAAQRAGLPLYQYLGGTSPVIDAYASGLCYHLSDEATHAFYRAAVRAGYRAAKVKVGHADPAWDLARVKLVADAMGKGATLMIDANEAWGAKQAAARLRMFADAGLVLHWVEDPLPRNDFAGLRYLRDAAGPVLVNSGEYLTPDERAKLIAAGGADIVNMNGAIGPNLKLAQHCVAANLPMTIGNSMMNVLAHLGAALPDVDMVEDSQLDWNILTAEPILIVDGQYSLPDRPGHGLTIAEDADGRCGGS